MSKTILLADDSATIRKIVELTFTDTEYHVETVGSGAEALDRLPRTHPDVVLADVGMPEPGGYELCRLIKESDRPVPVLLLAGAFEPLDPERARACGADGHLVKPFESAALVRRVAALIAAGAPARVAEPRVAPAPLAPAALHDAVPAAPPGPRPVAPAPLDPATLRELAREVVAQLPEPLLRELAREVVHRVAERVVRERIRELEADES